MQQDNNKIISFLIPFIDIFNYQQLIHSLFKGQFYNFQNYQASHSLNKIIQFLNIDLTLKAQPIQNSNMIPSQRRDGVFTFNMHANPLLPIIVDQKWRKDSFRDVNIYVPEAAKNMISAQNQEIPEIFTKFSSDKGKQWNDISIQDMLGRFSDLGQIQKKDK